MAEPAPARTPCLLVRIYYAVENRFTAWRIRRMQRRHARVQEEIEVAIQVEAIRCHVSVEQIKAEYRAELEAKGLKCPDYLIPVAARTDGFSPDAQRRWDQIPEAIRDRIIGSVWCSRCLKGQPARITGASMDKDLLLLHGVCTECGGKVTRVVEPDP